MKDITIPNDTKKATTIGMKVFRDKQCFKTQFLSKVLERCLSNHVASFVRPKIYLHQNGFLSGRSTVTQLLCFIHEVGATLDKPDRVDIAYLDFSKEFDSVSNKGIIYKLKHHGIWTIDCMFH